MTKGLVTIVLPIYNVEKYINRCIESVVSQTYSYLEIILVDDGSPDKCPQICDEWAEKDDRIKVIHKENQGLGMARNTGIENATGEYICFFDSDDYIAKDAIEKLYEALQENSADAIVFGFSKVGGNGEIGQTIIPDEKKLFYSGNEVREEFLPELVAPDLKKPGCKRYYMTAWSFMYSMEYINKMKWRFVSEREIISEDIYSLLGFFSDVQSVAVFPEALYYYCENLASLSRKYMPGRYEKIKHFYLKTIERCEENGYNQEVKHRISKPYMGFVLAALKQEVLADRKNYERISSFKNILNDDVLQRVLKETKHDKVSAVKRIIYWSMRNKLYTFCFLLFKLRTGF